MTTTRDETTMQTETMNGASDAERVRGVVRWFSADKGFGFIAPDGAPRDIFVHASEYRTPDHRGTLTKGDVVEFSVGADDRGRPIAADVAKIEGAP